MSLRLVWPIVDSSSPLGRNWRSNPLVFSLLPRCPGRMWVVEPDIHVRLMAELLEAGHLASPIVSQARAQESGKVLHLPDEAFKGILCRTAIHPAQDHEAGLALGEHADGRAVVDALDEVALPVPKDLRSSISQDGIGCAVLPARSCVLRASVVRRRLRSCRKKVRRKHPPNPTLKSP